MDMVMLVLFLVYCAYLAVSGYRDIKKIDLGAMDEARRILLYRKELLLGAVNILAVALIAALGVYSGYQLGLRPTQLLLSDGHRWMTYLALAFFGLLLAALLWQVGGYLFSKKYRAQIQAQFAAKSEAAAPYEKMLNILIPRTRREKRWYSLLSLMAGVNEELLFRGLLAAILASLLPDLPLWAFCLISGLLFGACHFYQGWRGLLKTSGLGAMLALLYLATNSLLWPMLLHFLLDLASAFLLREEQPDPA